MVSKNSNIYKGNKTMSICISTKIYFTLIFIPFFLPQPEKEKGNK